MKPQPLWNSVLNTKIYCILDANGRLVCEAQSDYAHMALRIAKADHGDRARTAIEKEQWKKMEAAETKWLRASRRVEA